MGKMELATYEKGYAIRKSGTFPAEGGDYTPNHWYKSPFALFKESEDVFYNSDAAQPMPIAGGTVLNPGYEEEAVSYQWFAQSFSQCPKMCAAPPDVTRLVECFPYTAEGVGEEVLPRATGDVTIDVCGVKPSETQACAPIPVGGTCDDGSDATVDDECTEKTQGAPECLGKAQLASALEYPVSADLKLPDMDADGVVSNPDDSPLANSLKPNIVSVMKSGGAPASLSEADVSINKIAVVANRRLSSERRSPTARRLTGTGKLT